LLHKPAWKLAGFAAKKPHIGYTITNPGSTTADFELVRYLDGDLFFDGSLGDQDGGGRLIIDGTEILFETDSATDGATNTNYVGITAEGGTEPVNNRYEIDSFSGLRTGIIAGTALDNTISGDGDADDFIDPPRYDVSMALRNTFSLGQGDTVVYVTKTIFGTGAPEDFRFPPPIGGSILPLDTTALLIAGINTNPYSILAVFTLLGAAAFGALYFTSKRRDQVSTQQVDKI